MPAALHVVRDNLVTHVVSADIDEYSEFKMSGNIIKLLMANVEPTTISSIIGELRKAGYTPYYYEVSDTAEMLSSLETQSWDIIFSPVHVGKFNALSVLNVLDQHKLVIPVVAISSASEEQVAVGLMFQGVVDIINPGSMMKLPAIIEREITRVKTDSRLQQLEAEIQELKNSHLSVISSSLTLLERKMENINCPAINPIEPKNKTWADIVSKNWVPVLLAAMNIILLIALLYAIGKPIPTPWGD